MSNFTFVAPFYDLLVSIVFGQGLFKAQCYGIDYLKLKSINTAPRILFVGGGTGSLLNSILSKFPQAHVTYLEASSGMIQRAQSNLKPEHKYQVDFVTSFWEDYTNDGFYDVIITNFVLDCFTDTQLKNIVSKGTNQLNEKGIWIFTDFINTDHYAKHILVKLMYFFFGVVARLKTQKLPDYKVLFEHNLLKEECSKVFVRKMVRSVVLRKQS